MTPSPIHSNQISCRYTPAAPIRNPPAQQHAATKPALRGPSRSAHRPNNAADDPRKKIASVNVVVSVPSFQSSGVDVVMPSAFVNGNQNTLKPYAIPIDRWMASAAGGTSQRLKLGFATMRSLDSSGGESGRLVV